MPACARTSGRVGRAIRCFQPTPRSLCPTRPCAPTRPPPARSALSWGCRAPLIRKNLRINADEATPRDLRFAVGTRSGPRPSCRYGAMAPAGRAASTRARICDAGARLDLAVDSNGLATSLKACAREADPVSAAAKAAALTCSAAPNAPAAGDEILALGRSTWSSPFGCTGGGPFR
jgi:hypothetical protein